MLGRVFSSRTSLGARFCTSNIHIIHWSSNICTTGLSSKGRQRRHGIVLQLLGGEVGGAVLVVLLMVLISRWRHGIREVWGSHAPRFQSQEKVVMLRLWGSHWDRP